MINHNRDVGMPSKLENIANREYISSSTIKKETGNITVDKIEVDSYVEYSTDKTLEPYVDEMQELETKKAKYRAIVETHKTAYHNKKKFNRAKKYVIHRKTHSKISSTIFMIRESYRDTIDDLVFVKKSVGPNGKEIPIYKLRTMVPGTDSMFNELAREFGTDIKGNLIYDPRITEKGAKRRESWIDELPQLYNLLKGDIKLVGIRPMGEKHWEEYSFKEKAIKYKPGLLGINYAIPKGSTKEEATAVIEKYLQEYEKRPILTDIKYFVKIWDNILFKGVRSS
jgi:lipopolysaccharide/colanic/teichoic acid biosynthesis glycosyltransferase